MHLWRRESKIHSEYFQLQPDNVDLVSSEIMFSYQQKSNANVKINKLNFMNLEFTIFLFTI